MLVAVSFTSLVASSTAAGAFRHFVGHDREDRIQRFATVMGAVVTVLHNTSNFYVVHKLS